MGVGLDFRSPAQHPREYVMRLLLDTHVLLWWWAEPERLPASLLATLSAAEADLWVSAVSGYELAYKHRLGKLGLPEGLLTGFEAAVAAERWSPLPVSLAHSLLAGQLDTEHRDPFDRLLAAQALVENATLVTVDVAFSGIEGLQTLWS